MNRVDEVFLAKDSKQALVLVGGYGTMGHGTIWRPMSDYGFVPESVPNLPEYPTKERRSKTSRLGPSRFFLPDELAHYQHEMELYTEAGEEAIEYLNRLDSDGEWKFLPFARISSDALDSVKDGAVHLLRTVKIEGKPWYTRGWAFFAELIEDDSALGVIGQFAASLVTNQKGET